MRRHRPHLTRAASLALAAGLALAAPPAAAAGTSAPAAKGAKAARPAKKGEPAHLPFIEGDYARALAEAKARNVPLVVDVWAPW
jgi:hypothetical protein